MLVISLDEVSQSDKELAGGKGANLGELIHQGFPVPPGFVVTAAAYADFVKEFGIPANDDIREETGAFCSMIRYRINSGALPSQLEQLIQDLHQKVAKGREDIVYAVRSSATAEDLADASFAGQHETYYYVRANNLATMVKKCWASLWSDAAFSYRQSKGIEHREVNMAVVVQEMILSEVSGVTFTADPVSGSENVIVTESSWGMGAAIVDGRVSPDQYVVDKSNGALTSVRIANKKFMVPPVLDQAEQSRLIEVPIERQSQESLTDSQVDEIVKWALKSEAYFECPQDLEWAIADDRVYLLQSRPITVVGEFEDEVPDGRYILFKPMAENFTDPFLPLSENILLRLFPMMKGIYGRVYMPVGFVSPIIPFKLRDDELTKLLYLQNIDERPPLSIFKLIFLFSVLIFSHFTFGVFIRRSEGMPDGFMGSFRHRFRKIVDDPRIDAPGAMRQLLLKPDFFAPVGHWVLHLNGGAGRYMILMEILKAMLTRWAPGIREDAVSLLSSGNEGVLSTEMGREIWQLSVTLKQTPGLKEIVLGSEPGVALNRLRENEAANDFCGRLDAFLAKHGHRALKEFELSSRRWEEDPAPIIAMVRNYLTIDSDPGAAEQKTQVERDALLQGLKSGLPAWKFRVVSGLNDRIRYLVKMRENSRFYHIMAFYAVRLKILEAERQLLDKSALKCKDDIFYLLWPEVLDLLHDRLQWADVETLIRERRMRHIRWQKMHPPRVVGIPLSEVDEPADTGGKLTGQGASPGIYRGRARVIMDPATNAEIQPGEVLVAPFTDPAWTPLFLTANAAVVEVGSYLSHAGTIAREYGMPCVVDVANCTTRLKSGDLIEVDGTTGTVRLLEDET